MMSKKRSFPFRMLPSSMIYIMKFNLFYFSIRGGLASINLFLRNIGILIAFVLGANIPYRLIPLINIFIPIIFTILHFNLPSTPQYLLKIGQTQVIIENLLLLTI